MDARERFFRNDFADQSDGGHGCAAANGGERVCGGPGESRTPDRLLRTQLLYPTELRGRRARARPKPAASATRLQPRTAGGLDTPIPRDHYAEASGKGTLEMARRYANPWADIATGLTALSHTRASVIRWGVIILLSGVWLGGGFYYWRALDPLESFYRTLGAVTMWDSYFSVQDPMLQLVRYAALATPAVGLLFAFSGQLGRSLAHMFNAGAAHHIVIAGDNPAALSLAQDCRRRDDAVILIAENLPEETTLNLRRKGVSVYKSHASHLDALRAARADHSAHVVAFDLDDTANLQIEAAMRRLMGNARRRRPVNVHVSTRSPMLLRETRQMRARGMARRRNKGQTESIDPKPFSLDELAARALFQSEVVGLLDLAAHMNQDRVHFVMLGFREAAEAVAVRVLMSLWSIHFQPPRITVLSQDAAQDEAAFRARYPDAFRHPQLWTADIAFVPFNWRMEHIDAHLMERIEAERGKPTAAVVAAGADTENIQLAMALRRACNDGHRWPIPIYMKEESRSEFSREYARGDDTPDQLDAYLKAFGAQEENATRARVLDGVLDRGAAIAHEHYNQNIGKRPAMSMRELQAAMKGWTEVLETYRASNRAVADSALVKVWDAGWRPAKQGETADTAPQMPDDNQHALSRREHDRWMAERMMSGWRPGEKRNDDMLHHDKLVGWDALSDADRESDAVQVRAAVDIARLLYPRGFVRRAPADQAQQQR